MNKFEKETEKVLLEHEKEAYNKLKSTYTTALKDIKLRIRDLKGDIELLKRTEGDEDENNLIKSKIYQLNYQKALEEQLNAVLDVVKTDNVKTTQSFLTKMYEDSFLSINYNLQKKGIPLIMPINNQKIVNVINTPTDKLKFSQRLYSQVDELKDVVKAEISRGIATGKGYGEIAKQVSRQTEADFNKSYRIARTEGGRVSSEAKLQSMKEAKDKGADIVKVWDATLDNQTRPIHQQLDGQWVEVDEDFKAGGYKTKGPHHFGIASQDINCRCVILSKPRWDLEETNTKRDNISGELIEAKNYADWKEKYYGVVSNYVDKTVKEKVVEEVKEIITKAIPFGNSNLTEELTNVDKKVLDYYVMDAGAYDINAVLRNGAEATKNDIRAIEDLTNAINKSTLNNDTEVYRYISNENVFYNLKEGDIYEDKGFMSTTYSNETDRENNYSDYRIKAVIQAKKGDNALDVSKLYDDQAYEGEEEREIIFNKNQSMKLVKVENVRDKYDEFTRKVYYFETVSKEV